MIISVKSFILFKVCLFENCEHKRNWISCFDEKILFNSADQYNILMMIKWWFNDDFNAKLAIIRLLAMFIQGPQWTISENCHGDFNMYIFIRTTNLLCYFYSVRQIIDDSFTLWPSQHA